MKTLKDNPFAVRLTSFLMMISGPILLYFAAEAGSTYGVWVLLALIAAAHLMIIFLTAPAKKE